MSDTTAVAEAQGPARDQRLRNGLLAMAVLTVAVGLLFAGFSTGFANPKPHNIPIAVVGPRSVQVELNDSPALSVHAAGDAATARRMVLDRSVYGALDFTGPRSVTLLVANGGGHSADAALTGIATALTQSSGANLRVVDLAPTSSNDPSGTVEFYCIVFLAVGAALGANVLGQIFGSIRNLRDVLGRLGTLTLFSAMAALAVTFLSDIVLGATVGHFGLLLLTLWAYTLSIAIAVSGVKALLGTPAGVILTLSLVILGNTSAGGPVSRPLLNPFLRAINPYLPHGAGMSIVRGVLYFDGRGPIAGPVLCLVGWAAGGVALLAIRAWRAGRSETDGTAAGPADTAGRAENTTGTSPARTAEPLGAV